jgi:hypothetical protein
MFETKVDSQYETYNGINQNIYLWKKYNSTSLRVNTHGLLELPFDLSDATLKGSSDYIEKMTEVISRYQVRLNFRTIQENAVTNCTKTAACSEILSDSKADMENWITDYLMSDYSSQTDEE